jgi:hypothetical protein
MGLANLPLTKRVHAFDFVSCGLAILSHKGRGDSRGTALPQAAAEGVAPYLSPCGRGYEGRVSETNPWPKLVRGRISGAAA